MPEPIQWFFASLGAIVGLNVAYMCTKAVALGVYARWVNRRAEEEVARGGFTPEHAKTLLMFYRWTPVFVFVMALPLPFLPLYEKRFRGELLRIRERSHPPPESD